MRKTQTKIMVPMSLKLILLLVFAVVVLRGYSAAAQVAGPDNQQTPTSVTMLNPFTLVESTVPVTDITAYEYEHRNNGEDYYHQHRHRHQRHRSPSAPEL